jgi:hypothetical protein
MLHGMELKKLYKVTSYLLTSLILFMNVVGQQQDKSVVVSLKKGWNLVSIPLKPSDASIKKSAQALSGKLEAVFTFNNKKKKYEFYIPGDPRSTITEFEPGAGYWILMNTPVDFTVTGRTPLNSVKVYEGWNLVGYTGLKSLSIKDAFSSIDGQFNVVYAYDTESKSYKGYIPARTEEFSAQIEELLSVEPAGAYWIHVDTVENIGRGNCPDEDPQCERQIIFPKE